ncbi:hypothetical protein PHLCEN_2v3280 [Hermanssonia centrifuga]|uniref:Uncharacterized protein n=1 Tax=Hermanssonia centrifuga TaxID=98765 RepID=A0A2R6QUH9_9APHY|nr:hypothetical protein PHLCEN_2v3280 [Hermanssonia centrifuga]
MGPKALKKQESALAAPSVPLLGTTSKDTSLLRAALKGGMDSGLFFDTKFYAFSQRKPSGATFRPKPIYSNSGLLQARLPAYFGPLLSGDDREASQVGPLHGGFPTGKHSFNVDYEYSEDSDIEDDTTEDDSDLPVDDASSARKGTGGIGRIVILPHVAYSTWKALIFYLVTGEVAFAPLKSQRKESVKEADTDDQSPPNSSAPLCSPKSMYRIADQLELEDLKVLAQNDILSKLSADNILSELFSEFTSKHETICDLEITFACEKALDTISEHLAEWIKKIVLRERPYGAEVLASLFQRLAQSASKSAQTSQNTSEPPPTFNEKPSAFTDTRRFGSRTAPDTGRGPLVS